ncbi:MAG: tRNA lysidine(34) synthetase TilS, partial [Burkholderiales bacterium]|nr:tRNA lysidine(34) synthetase TilS [Burkholderiales bacterium]
GIDATLLNNARKVWISGRQNNKEVLKCAHRPRRAIIDLLREANIPHWARDRWPRLYLDNELAAVPNIGINERFLAAPKANGFHCVFQETDDHRR